jgi:hypothetical protein
VRQGRKETKMAVNFPRGSRKFVISAILVAVLSLGTFVLPDHAQVATVRGHKVMIFGGEGHKIYLGCLSCTEYASDSILNEYGSHGSPYQSESIFNPYGRYGSKYDNYSACNPFASDPPVIVDDDGNYYGRLTVNKFKDPTKSQTVRAWLAGVCADHE